VGERPEATGPIGPNETCSSPRIMNRRITNLLCVTVLVGSPGCSNTQFASKDLNALDAPIHFVMKNASSGAFIHFALNPPPKRSLDPVRDGTYVLTMHNGTVLRGRINTFCSPEAFHAKLLDKRGFGLCSTIWKTPKRASEFLVEGPQENDTGNDYSGNWNLMVVD